ncbi:hypothetical protein EVAR_32970_1 [Eumeta japonica]|uniref:Uncharacterized protein n=1 Tax=Eumeta variegata TaxID=151549 RepID=A0A4C1WWA8_EUMVA|nr:hypothetical protein EVAR_32970_1 [Eumeta japonica]
MPQFEPYGRYGRVVLATRPVQYITRYLLASGDRCMLTSRFCLQLRCDDAGSESYNQIRSPPRAPRVCRYATVVPFEMSRRLAD